MAERLQPGGQDPPDTTAACTAGVGACTTGAGAAAGVGGATAGVLTGAATTGDDPLPEPASLEPEELADPGDAPRALATVGAAAVGAAVSPS